MRLYHLKFMQLYGIIYSNENCKISPISLNYFTSPLNQINAEMVRKQNTIKYPYLRNDSLFHSIFFLSVAMGNAFISCFWYYNFDKRCN